MDLTDSDELPEQLAGAGLPRAMPVAAPAPRTGLPPGALRAIQASVLLSLFAIGGAAAWRYREVLKAQGAKLADSVGQVLTLSVVLDVNLEVDVSVRHAAKENLGDAPVALGRTPLGELSGLHAGDVLVLDDPATGAHHEEELVLGLPGETVTVRKVFRAPAVKLRVEPSRLADTCRVSRVLEGKEQDLGPCSKPFPLVEGRHVLAARLPKMRQPKLVDVEVKPGESPSPLVDLSKWAE
jgi:hypothetical protein